MSVTKKLLTILAFALFFSLFSFAPETFAGTTSLPWSFVNTPPPTLTLDTTNVIKVEVAANNFDDNGGITIIAPSGATSSAGSPGGCLKAIPSGDISSKFLDGFGPGKIYTIQVYINNTCGGPYGSWGSLTITTQDYPTCSLTASPSSIGPMESSVLSWTTTGGATSASIDNGLGSVSVPSGSTTVSPTSSTTYNMDVVNGSGGGSCSATVSVTGPPSAPGGGLVPCGRLADDGATSGIDESKPCDLCSTFYMVKNIFNFVMLDIAIPIGVFMLVISGLIYASAAGNSRRTEQAKTAIKYTIIGLVIIFAAWLIIAALLKMLGYADITTWNQVNCTLAT